MPNSTIVLTVTVLLHNRSRNQHRRSLLNIGLYNRERAIYAPQPPSSTYYQQPFSGRVGSTRRPLPTGKLPNMATATSVC